MSDSAEVYTVRLELVDEPGELRRALAPIADNGGNLRSVVHERGSLTPRGHIPVEVALAATPERFEAIVAALRETGVNVIRAGAERYGEELTVIFVGDLVESDLSDTLSRLDCASASVADVSLSAPEGTPEPSSARVRLATRAGERERVLDTVHEVAAEKDLLVIEPLAGADR